MDASDVQEVEQLFERFITAFNSGDLETLRSSYTSEAILVPPGQPVVRGPQAIITQMWGPMAEAFDVDAALPIEELQLSEEWGFVRGTYRMRLDPKAGGDSLSEEGRWIDIVRKEAGGGWRIARAIWNTS